MQSITKEKTPFWRNKRIVPTLLQALFLILIVSTIAYFFLNSVQGLKKIGITLGFHFLTSNASFSISDTLIDFSPSDSYGKAMLVGLLNTLKVSVLGIIFSILIGLIIGIARLSTNGLARLFAATYIEIFRNIPLLVQITMLYLVVFLPLPRIENSIHFFDIAYLSNRGNAIPWFAVHSGWGVWLVLLIFGLFLARYIWKVRIAKQMETGVRAFSMLWGAGATIFVFLIAFVITGQSPLSISVPVINGKSFSGGYVISSEFASILLGLITYTSAFIAEIVRGGILAVPKGQTEAAKALGLKKSTILRLIILPQANRIIIPPATSQLLNLIKNSSLAVAVGYSDLFSVGNTIINQTGRAIEMIALIGGVYLALSLLTSLLMNMFNKHYQLIER
ncbi:ABC transporter permease subunit [Brevibacillus fluminis]|uniref:ABC transporter permease subunit n=1 Tax=Brevibacillus fluminis TaxID=511487 RepID=A0A3M8DBT7_9BACL|nr:ABC transporter permease subunit [Brevibacillus fluminis]RNB85456.1 ABC transporter permease subunit [Brevibacillus fluminis]